MDLKKCTSLILVFLLLASNTGFAFNVHYCGTEIASVSLKIALPGAEKGCCGIAEKKSHCCSDKVVHFQKKSDNTVVKSFAFQTAVAVPAINWQPMIVTAIQNFKSEPATTYYCDANGPPLFKLYSQYLFYDKL